MTSATSLQLTAVICIFTASAWSQETRAILSGTVTDPQDAAVPLAAVELKNLGTNVVTKVGTNDAGVYTTPPVNPGNYLVTVSAAGFKVAVENNVELRSADRKLLDFHLQLGAASETVAVIADAPLLDTATASKSSIINSDLVAAVPTYALDVFQLVRYSAGANGGTTVRPFDGSDNGASILGGPGNTNEVLMDGSPNTYRESTSPANTISPPPDAVGEVKVITNAYDAEYGRTGGGVISVSLKSGTNQYHGAVQWLVRNPILNANAFEANASGAPNASFHMNEPTAELDGPVRIPKVYDGRNRTFFTYAVDIYRDDRPTTNTMTVPTELERKGNFSQTFVSGTSGPTVAIYDPLTTVQNGSSYTRSPFPNGIIPPSLINPIAAKVASLYLEPGYVSPRGQPNLGVYPNYDHEPFNSHVFRGDHKLSAKQTIFVTVARDLRGQTNGLGQGLQAYQALGDPYVSNSYTHWRGNVAASFNVTSVISPTLISTTRASFNRHEFGIQYYSFGYDPTQLGFPASLVKHVQDVTFPQFAVANYVQLGGGNGTLNYSTNIVAGEALTKIVGKHAVKFGGEARALYNNQKSPPNSFNISASAGFTQADPLVPSATSGDALASFLLGYPSAVSTSYNSYPAEGQRFYAAFVQDDWRVSTKLTLNLGFRWEYESPITDRFNNIVDGFNSATASNLEGPSGPPVTGGLLFATSSNRLPYPRDLDNIAPRLGFAYQVASKLVLRGGWGITYTPTADVAPTTGFSISTAPATSVSNAGSVPITTAGCTGNNCGLLSNPFPTGVLLPPGRSLGLLTNVGQSISFISPTRTTPYSHTVSIGFQYELPFRTVLEVSYNGRFSRGVATAYNRDSISSAQYQQYGSTLTSSVTNPFAGLLPGTSLNGSTITLAQSLLPYPQYTGVTENSMPLGKARYNALVFQLEKRLSSGLSFVVNGTFGKATTYSTYLNNGMDAPGQFITRDGGTPPYQINLIGTYTEQLLKRANRAVRTMLDGWQIAGYAQFVSGALLNVSGTANNPVTSTGIDPSLPHPTFQRWFNTCTLNANSNQRQNCASATEPVAWIIQKPYTLVTQPNPQWSDFRGRSVPEISISLFKTFNIRERLRFQLRADADNATNQPTFPAPNTTPTSSLFGVTTLTQGFGYSSISPRQIQLGARLMF